MEADVLGVCVIRSVVFCCLVVGPLVVGAAFVDIFVVGTGLVMVSVSLSNVVLLARDDALTWLVRGAAFVDIFVVGTGLVMVSVSLSNEVLLARDDA